MSEMSSRWWEGYAVRYGVGTVVGGIVFTVLCSMNDSLKPFMFGALDVKFEIGHIILLGAYGFAYCYLASAPILVFHTSRWVSRRIGQQDLHGVIFLLLVILFVPVAFGRPEKGSVPLNHNNTQQKRGAVGSPKR